MTPRHCRPIEINGARGFVCGSFERQKSRCFICGMPAEYLCDGRIGTGGMLTCDKPICGEHRKSIGPDLDLCPTCVMRGDV